MNALIRTVCTLTLCLVSLAAQAFDHSHAAWNKLLEQHVVVNAQGTASTVRYAGLKAERAALKRYLDTLSAVKVEEYRGWSRDQKLAFLINAYNAFTVELILSKYPKLDSIKDLGTFLSSPWKQTFFTLLGKKESLDGIEHDRIRAPGAVDAPRIHAAVVCASIGCPMRRNEAYVDTRLDAQLEDQMTRFLRDRSRNRFDAASNTLFVSKIFDWYAADFTNGHRGFDSLKTSFAHYSNALSDAPAERARIKQGHYQIEYLDYDWRLNDAR